MEYHTIRQLWSTIPHIRDHQVELTCLAGVWLTCLTLCLHYVIGTQWFAWLASDVSDYVLPCNTMVLLLCACTHASDLSLHICNWFAMLCLTCFRCVRHYVLRCVRNTVILPLCALCNTHCVCKHDLSLHMSYVLCCVCNTVFTLCVGNTVSHLPLPRVIRGRGDCT